MTVYKDISLINMIIQYMPNDWDVYVHIDSKSQINVSEINQRVYVIKKYAIKWGSINHLYAILDLLSMAMSKSYKDTYFHIITGQDFFVTPPGKFNEKLVDGKIYLDIKQSAKWYDGGKDIWRYRTLAPYIDLRKVFNRKFNRLYMIVQRLFNLCKRLPNYPIYGGLVYCSLPYYAVEYVLNSEIAKDMLRELKYSAVGEEIFFQTVLMNSPYRENIIFNNLRYSDWSVKNSPKLLTEEDFDKIIESGDLFCRKVGRKESSQLINLLCAHMSNIE